MDQLSSYLVAIFPLFQVPPALLEKIFTKVPFLLLILYRLLQFESTSYFRLQQTCRAVEEFVRTNRNIKNIPVCYRGLRNFFSITGVHGYLRLWSEYFMFNGNTVDTESPYGVRFSGFKIQRLQSNNHSSDISEDFENYCSLLKKYRITCTEVKMEQPICLTKEQCVTLLNILKPVDIHLYSIGSNRYEAFLEARGLVIRTYWWL